MAGEFALNFSNACASSQFQEITYRSVVAPLRLEHSYEILWFFYRALRGQAIKEFPDFRQLLPVLAGSCDEGWFVTSAEPRPVPLVRRRLASRRSGAGRFSTVVRERRGLSAISLFDRPAAANRATCRSAV